ncbi:MAG: tetratricopeptide repeat protein [Calditrichaeota bacterium]|nr:MAG: tetratricopeptide repeat protein [Calditrichota bacterium]
MKSKVDIRESDRRHTVKCFQNSLLKNFVFLSLFLSFISLPVIAQEPDEDEEMEPAACFPEEVMTKYDQEKEAGVDQKQIAIWYSFGNDYYKYKKYDDAIPYFWKIVVNDSSPKFRVVYYKLSDSYFHKNEIDSTLLVIKRGLERFPNYARLHYLAGYIHRTLGHVNCAIPHYEALTKADPKQKSYWQILAQLYFQAEDERAIEAQRKVIELDPQDPEASNTLVQMMSYFGLDPMQAMKEAFDKDPTNVSAAMRYGKAALESGNYQEAERAFQTVIQNDPSNEEALTYLGRTYEATEQLSKAIQTYKKVIEHNPQNLNVLCSIASAYAHLNNFTTARSYVYKARKVDPSSGLPYMILGEIYEAAIDHCANSRDKKGYTYDDKLVFEKARAAYRQAAKDPNYAASANSRYSQLKPFIRTIEDKHLYSHREKIKDPCYSWIE